MGDFSQDFEVKFDEWWLVVVAIGFSIYASRIVVPTLKRVFTQVNA